MYIKDRTELRDKFTLLYRQAEHLLEAGAVDVEVKKHKHIRSKEQNNYYWLICSEVANFLRLNCPPYGEDKLDYDNDLIHKINKKKHNVDTTTKLSIQEFCDYMTEVILYWQERTNWEWAPSELPVSYLAQRGYTEEYTRGAIRC